VTPEQLNEPSRKAAEDYSPGRRAGFALRPGSKEDTISPEGAKETNVPREEFSMVNRKANLKRNNHFLPECYQKGFVDSTGKVWAKFPDKNEHEHRNPSLGKKRSLYIRSKNGTENDDVEDFFDKAVEAPFALFSQHVREEQNKLAHITSNEQAALLKFVASQTVRTLAHKSCIDEQAGYQVDKNTFNFTIVRLMRDMADSWLTNMPGFHFYTSLLHVGEQFISGDHPVLIVRTHDNPIWTPTGTPKLKIDNANELLADPRTEFMVPLSPYIYASLRSEDNPNVYLPPQTLDPVQVRFLNDLMRGQCNLFTFAKNKESLTSSIKGVRS